MASTPFRIASSMVSPSEVTSGRAALAIWKSDVKAAIDAGEKAPSKPEAADAGPPPTRERIYISDITTEKVAALLAASWRGPLLTRDELSGWLSGMDRYNGGGDHAFWLEAYGGRTYTVDRKASTEPTIVDHLSVAVLGGTQPDKLASLLAKTDDDGLLARFLTAFPDPVPLSRPYTKVDQSMLVSALSTLRSLEPATDESGIRRPKFVTFDDRAADTLQEFRVQCREWEVDASGPYKSHVGKLPGIAVRVACVLSHLDWAAQSAADYPTCVNVADIGRACHLVGERLRLHALRAYGTAIAPRELQNARKLASLILKDRPDQVTVRAIQRRGLGGMQTSKSIAAAFDVLDQADWLRCKTERTSGRPRKFYTINPRLWGQA